MIAATTTIAAAAIRLSILITQMNDETLNHAFSALIIVSHMKQQVPRISRETLARINNKTWFRGCSRIESLIFGTFMIEANDGLIRMIIIARNNELKKNDDDVELPNNCLKGFHCSRFYTSQNIHPRPATPATGEIIIPAHNRHIKYCFAVLRARAPCIRRQYMFDPIVKWPLNTKSVHERMVEPCYASLRLCDAEWVLVSTLLRPSHRGQIKIEQKKMGFLRLTMVRWGDEDIMRKYDRLMLHWHTWDVFSGCPLLKLIKVTTTWSD